jgi:hypothetical protein
MMSDSGWTRLVQDGVEDDDLIAFRSPDLTPTGYFLWGHLKEYDYAVPPRTLVARLQATVTTVDANILRRVLEKPVPCIALCLEGRFEHLL